MKKKLSYTKDLLLIQWLQLFITVICFYLFSSKIKGFPWYFNLTTYMLLYLIIIAVLQLLLCIFIGFLCEMDTAFKKPLRMGLLKLCILIAMIFVCIGSIQLFSILTIFCAFLELLLLIYLLRTLLKPY